MTDAARDGLEAKIAKLKEEYPMVCVKVWTPDDFAQVAKPGAVADWNDEIHIEVARGLSRAMDEDPSFSSQNWLRISKTIQLARERMREAGGTPGGK